jgi:RsiW-degrading membrane proteinase PrsW (M82 family)
VAAAPPAAPRARADVLYWALLLALLPLVLALFRGEPDDPGKRLERTLDAHPELRAQVKALLMSGKATLDGLLRILPGRRLDDRAFLPRDTEQHWAFAAASGTGFFILIGVLMARGVAPAWRLLLAALFTATFGIACLFVLQDFTGHSYRIALEPERSFLSRLLGFTFGVGLGEELCKSLPVLFYLRSHRGASWRGACYWGMASGVGFGVAEGVMYSARWYNGVVSADVYLTRFAACVALHAVWSASVGITLFHSRRLVGRLVGAVLFGGRLTWEEVAWPLLRVLGVAMALHGLYDALLTEQLIVPALLVALASFGWLAWQIETGREQEAAVQAVVEDDPVTAGAPEAAVPG